MIADISVSNMVFTQNISNEITAFIRLPSICEGRKVNDIVKESDISQASMYHILKKRELLTQVITTENVNYNGQNVDDERPAKLSSCHKRLLLRERTSYSIMTISRDDLCSVLDLTYLEIKQDFRNIA